MRTTIPRSQLVELHVPANAAGIGWRQNFLDQPLLRTQKGKTVYILGMSCLSNQAYTQFPNGNTVATAAAIRGASLYLSIENFFQFWAIPLAQLNPIYAEDGANFVPYQQGIFWFDNAVNVIWTESFVEFGPSPAGLGVPFSFAFNVYYDLTPHQYQ